tara:strand:- start:1090 stop:1890 length:801 start_codon:yes stop_codon:yes gene_type:complete
MIKSLLKNDEKLLYIHQLFYNSLTKNQKKIYKKINSFLKLYCKYNCLKNNQLIKEYYKFLNRYMSDCKNFSKLKKYPYQISKVKKLNRTSYEIALILSCLITPHRFAIMEEISKIGNLKKSLFIGAGTGLEIYLIKEKLHVFKAYDVGSSKFIYQIIKKENFEQRLYNFSETEFKTIFAIEFLEHLQKPYEFLAKIYTSMKKNSRLVCTTAKNIPQFDHLYNFTSSTDFEKKVKKIGFKISYSNIIAHQYDLQKINSNNIFYILKK